MESFCTVHILSIFLFVLSGCMKLGQFSEKMVKVGGRQGKVVYVGGANLQNLNLIDRCELVLYSGDTEATPRVRIKLYTENLDYIQYKLLSETVFV